MMRAFANVPPVHRSRSAPATRPRFKLRKLAQAVFDVFVVAFWIALVALIFCAVLGSVGAMLFLKF